MPICRVCKSAPSYKTGHASRKHICRAGQKVEPVKDTRKTALHVTICDAKVEGCISPIVVQHKHIGRKPRKQSRRLIPTKHRLDPPECQIGFCFGVHRLPKLTVEGSRLGHAVLRFSTSCISTIQTSPPGRSKRPGGLLQKHW